MTEDERRPEQHADEQDRYAEDQGTDVSTDAPEQALPPGDDGHSVEEEDPTHGQLGHFGRDYLIPGVEANDPALQVAYGREARPRRRGRDRDHRRRQAVRPHAILNGVNLGLPDNQDFDGARPLRNRQERADQAHRRPAVLRLGRRPRPRRVGAVDDRRRALRGAQEVRAAVPGRRPVRVDERVYDNTRFPLRQHTDKGEDEIGEIVDRRLKEVGLKEAMDKMPNELGRMRAPASRARSCSTPRSSCSTSPIRASTRCARRCAS